MIERWWIFIPGTALAALLAILFCRYGVASSRTLFHPLTGLLLDKLSGRISWSRRAWCLALCAALFFLNFSASGPRWGERLSADYQELRFIAFLFDRSGSMSKEQLEIVKKMVKQFFLMFQDSAAVTIVPFASHTRPSPVFVLKKPQQLQYAMTWLDRIDEIDVGSSTEGGWALYAAFYKLMVAGSGDMSSSGVLSREIVEGTILPLLINREVRLHEQELSRICHVKDRAVIVGSDMIFSESTLHSAEVLELYRICGVRAYLLNVQGKDNVYLREAAEASGGKLEYVPQEAAGNPIKFEATLGRFFGDILVVERAPQKVRETVILVPRSRIFAAISLGFGGLALFFWIKDRRQRRKPAAHLHERR